jgi:hypothetical protein
MQTVDINIGRVTFTYLISMNFLSATEIKQIIMHEAYVFVVFVTTCKDDGCQDINTGVIQNLFLEQASSPHAIT